MHFPAYTDDRPQFAATRNEPEHLLGWAQGLRHVYAGVATEPIPADWSDLLGRLHRLER